MALLAATALRAALVPSSGAIAASIFPPAVVLGTTYTWNATTFQYEANDPAVVPGAPSNGVRFILYALDLAGQPIATQPIGYADLMDESSGNTQTLHVLVVGTTTDPPVTYLDYAVSVTVGASTANVAVVGFITDGIERLDFNAAIGETTGSATFDIRFDENAGRARPPENDSHGARPEHLAARHQLPPAVRLGSRDRDGHPNLGPDHPRRIGDAYRPGRWRHLRHDHGDGWLKHLRGRRRSGAHGRRSHRPARDLRCHRDDGPAIRRVVRPGGLSGRLTGPPRGRRPLATREPPPDPGPAGVFVV